MRDCPVLAISRQSVPRCVCSAEFFLVEKFSNWAHRPFVGPFENNSGKKIGVLIACELTLDIQVCRAPIPTLRNDAGDAGAKAGITDTVRQQNTELGCDARAGLVLQHARTQDVLQKRPPSVKARGPGSQAAVFLAGLQEPPPSSWQIRN